MYVRLAAFGIMVEIYEMKYLLYQDPKDDKFLASSDENTQSNSARRYRDSCLLFVCLTEDACHTRNVCV